MDMQANHGIGRRADSAGRGEQHRATLLSVGGVVAALGAASCCVIPFALFLVGVSGAWIGDLTALAPYQPVFAAVALGCIVYGATLVRRARSAPCAEGSACARPATGRLARIGLWSAGTLVIVAVGFPWLIRVFLPS